MTGRVRRRKRRRRNSCGQADRRTASEVVQEVLAGERKPKDRACVCVLKITHFSRDIYGYLKASPQILFSSLRKKIVMCKILRSLKFESSEAVVEYYEIWKCNISTYQDGRNSQELKVSHAIF